MATASALSQPGTTLHTRGTWSARDDRTASAVYLGVLWVGMIAGFGVDFPRYLRENPAAPMIVHIHGAIYSVWMLLLTVQVLLVVRDRVALHRRLGWLLAGWACLMGVMGPVAIMVSQAANMRGGPVYDPPFLCVAFNNVLCFLILLACGIALRKNPAAHRRLMILSSVSLADPGFARFSGWIWPQEPASIPVWFVYTFYGNVLLIALMTAWDWYRGRLMRQFVIGASALLAAEFTATVLYFWGPWRALSASWVAGWARHFG
ncbi:hypothetical protein [Occallatibacter riparius]|uniref:DUF2306 domain-containing protein n=1 Tax=Occallatibacter riparius TaxID=1002689 RepID=A0A9J7BV01_9BACT|nr:hypothetical protein [Occallatibacter riparius]UWZ84742.1 hypothetical protein MOP44_02120 [Occallatibacter riparius]